MSAYAAALGGGFQPLAQIEVSNTSGADDSLPFAGLTSGRAYTLQVKTGTLKVNFLGVDGAWFELGPGIYSDVIDWNLLKAAKIDESSAFTGVLLMQGVL